MVALDAIAVAAAFGFMVVSNMLAQTRVLSRSGKDNQQVSHQNPTYVTPDDPTFGMWGIVYTLLMVLTVAQLFPTHRTEALMEHVCSLSGLNVRWRLVLAFFANSLWLPLFDSEQFFPALGMMVAYLSFLTSIYNDVNPSVVKGPWDTVILTTGISMNTAWILLATAMNVFVCGGLLGWKDARGVHGTVPAAIAVVLAAAALAAERAWRGDIAWALATAWGLRGIYRMQTVPDKDTLATKLRGVERRFPISAMDSNLAATARFSSLAVAGVALFSGARMVGPAIHALAWPLTRDPDLQ